MSRKIRGIRDSIPPGYILGRTGQGGNGPVGLIKISDLVTKAVAVGVGSGTNLPAIGSPDLLANISGASATPSDTTLTALIDAALGSTQGDVLYRDTAAWKVLAPGTINYFLQTGGAGANPSWVAGAIGANPTATAGPTAINGTATTFMRSDGAPAVQKASNSQFGLVSGDGTTITVAAGVASIPSSVALPGSPTTTTQTSGDNSTKIATTAFVQSVASGINPAVAVQAATTAAGDTSGLTYNNGASGIGATLTGSNNTALTIDGFTFTTLGQRLLVKNDTQSPSGAFNGVYYVTQLQASLLPPILTRALDYDQPSDINNTGIIPVINGTANKSTTWAITSTVNTVGTDPLTYAQFSKNPANAVTAASSLAASTLVVGDDGVDGVKTVTGLNINAGAGSVLFQLKANAGQVAMQLIGVAGANSFTLASPNSAGASFGPSVTAGTNSSDQAFLVRDATGVNYFFQINGTGGMVAGSNTLTDEGLGTLNVSGGLYKSGTAYTNPDYVLEYWAAGRVEKFADRLGASEYDGLWPLAKVREFCSQNFTLPRVAEARERARKKGHTDIFEGGDAVLASLEEAYLYIFQQQKQIDALTKRLEAAGI